MNENAQIDEEHTFVYNGRTHRIFISTDGLICFFCRTRGHIARSCPKKTERVLETEDETPSTSAASRVDDDGFTLVQPKEGHHTKNRKQVNNNNPVNEDDKRPQPESMMTDATAKENVERDQETKIDSASESNNNQQTPKQSSESKHHKARHDIDYNQLIDTNVDNLTVNNTRDTVQNPIVPTVNNTFAKDSETTLSPPEDLEPESFDTQVRTSQRRARSVSPV